MHFQLRPVPARKIAFTYAMLSHHYMPGPSGWGRVPCEVSCTYNMNPHVQRDWLRVLAGVHPHIPAREFGCVKRAEYKDKLCNKCLLGEVADESHVFLKCTATAAVRHKYCHAFQWCAFPTFCMLAAQASPYQLTSFIHDALQAFSAAHIPNVDDMPLRQRAILTAQQRL